MDRPTPILLSKESGAVPSFPRLSACTGANFEESDKRNHKKVRLGSDLGGKHRRFDPPRLGDGARDRLGAVNVLVHRQARQHQVRMPVIRRGDDQSIEVLLLLVEHLPEVFVDSGSGIEFERRRGELVVEVAKGDDLLVLAAGHIVLAHAADAHAGDPKLVAGSPVARSSEHVARNHERRQACGDRSAPGQRAFGRFVRIHENVP